MLGQLFANRNDTLPKDRSLVTMFHTERAPEITVQAYFKRIARYCDCTAESLVLALVHINRLIHNRPPFKVTSLNIHRLLLISIMSSAKFFDDQYYNNAYYGKVGGVPTREVNALEIEFLALINFDLYIQEAEYQTFLAELCSPALHSCCQCKFQNISDQLTIDFPSLRVQTPTMVEEPAPPSPQPPLPESAYRAASPVEKGAKPAAVVAAPEPQPQPMHTHSVPHALPYDSKYHAQQPELIPCYGECVPAYAAYPHNPTGGPVPHFHADTSHQTPSKKYVQQEEAAAAPTPKTPVGAVKRVSNLTVDSGWSGVEGVLSFEPVDRSHSPWSSVNSSLSSDWSSPGQRYSRFSSRSWTPPMDESVSDARLSNLIPSSISIR